LLTWACRLATMLFKFSRSWVSVWKNCCMAGSICPYCCALPELLALLGRVTGADQHLTRNWCSPSEG
jgi:hypothetical protein